MSKKARAIKKSAPISAERIIDSDSETDTGAETNGSPNKHSIKASKESVPPNGTKRKSEHASESSTTKRIKTTSTKGNQDSDQAIESSLRSATASHLNGKSATSSSVSDRSSSDTSESDSGDAESESSVDGVPESIAESPEKESRLISAIQASTSTISDSSNASSENEEEENAEDIQSQISDTSRNLNQEIVIAASARNASNGPPPYRPPEGFSKTSMNSGGIDNVRAILSADNLSQKQLWHITLPATVPIAEVKRIARTDMLNGKSVLSHKGSKYAFSTERVSSSKILIPGRKGNKYESIDKDIDLHLHLRQIVDLRDLTPSSTQSQQGSSLVAGAKKPTLKQPIGLRMRYRPFGDVDDSTNEKVAKMQAEQRIDNAKISLPAIPSTSPKKSKKSKKESQSNHASVEWRDPQTYSAPIVIGDASQHTVDVPSTGPDDSQLTMEGGEASEERTMRRAEKAARREKRRKRKEAQAATA